MLNEFFVATYLHLYQLWKSQQKTIADSGFVIKGKSAADPVSSPPSPVLLSLSLVPCVTPSVGVSVPSEVELFAKKNPKQMLRRLEVFLKERRAGGIPRGTSPDPQAQQPSPSLGERGARARTGQGGKTGKEMGFTGVCDLPPDMEGEARLI